MKRTFLLFILVFLLLEVNGKYSRTNDAVLLENVKTLVFAAGEKTSSRRSSAIAQLECVGGSASSRRDLYPSTVLCKNVGSDGFDVQWQCEAELESLVKLGKIDVSCEGYDYPEDKYILRGSCGLRYYLEFRESPQGFRRHSQSKYFSDRTSTSSGSNQSPTDSTRQRFSGGGADDGNPPPPPYSQSFPSNSSFPFFGRSSHNSSGSGFWSGMGLGGVLGYLAGSRRRNAYYSNYGSSWNTGNSWRSSGTHYSAPHSSTGSRQRSTAFGGTTRR